MSAASAALFEERVDPGKVSSALLAAAVHLALLAVLVFGVRWQNRPPEAVSVELWEPPPRARACRGSAQARAQGRTGAAAEPVVKPEPVIPKPDIVVKAPPPKPKPVPRWNRSRSRNPNRSSPGRATRPQQRRSARSWRGNRRPLASTASASGSRTSSHARLRPPAPAGRWRTWDGQDPSANPRQHRAAAEACRAIRKRFSTWRSCRPAKC